MKKYNKYYQIAILIIADKNHPINSWEEAVKEVFMNSISSQEKLCQKLNLGDKRDNSQNRCDFGFVE